MKFMLAILFLACITAVSLGQDCKAKFQESHKCMEDSHQADEDAIKAKLDAINVQMDKCYTDNGCQPPVLEGMGKGNRIGGNNSNVDEHEAKNDCFKHFMEAIKHKMDACIKRKVPDFNPEEFPSDGGHHEKRSDGPSGHARPKGHAGPGGPGGRRASFSHKSGKNATCPNIAKIHECKRALFNKSKPSEDDMKAKFQAHCQNKKKCSEPLATDCQAKLENVTKASCECHHEIQAEPAETSSITVIPECQHEFHRLSKRQAPPQCGEHKDYCNLENGYEAMKADMVHPKKPAPKRKPGKSH